MDNPTNRYIIQIQVMDNPTNRYIIQIQVMDNPNNTWYAIILNTKYEFAIILKIYIYAIAEGVALL